MSNTLVTKRKELHSVFENMNLSKAGESNSLALSWLEEHQKTFYGFLDGCWLNKEKIEEDVKSEMVCHKICDVYKEKHLCDVYTHDNTLLEYVAKSSAAGFKEWSTQPAALRSRILYKVSQAIEKYEQLFAIVEALSTAKHLHKVKRDIPNLIESFRYYAGCALKLDDPSTSKMWFPMGPICVLNEEFNNPALTLSLRVCSALASGNSVFLLTDVKSSLSSFLLAEICSESGIPAGVLNVIPIDQDNLKTLGKSDVFSKIIFTGTLEKSVLFSKLCSEVRLSCDFLIPRRPVVIVYEDADLHSAANGVVEAFLHHDIRSKSGGCKVMIQESIHEKFLDILRERFYKIQVGDNLSKTDFSCFITDKQKNFLKPFIKETTKIPGQSFCLMFMNKKYLTMMPIFFGNLPSSQKLVHEELGGPIGVAVRFRTVKESISMFNCDNKGSPVSIWTEKISVALEAAMKLKSGVICVNSENIIDAKTAFTGIYLSGNSVEGGQDAFFSHLSLLPETARMNKANAIIQSQFSKFQESSSIIQGISENKKEYKLYIGGIQKRSSKNALILNETTLISPGTESDVQSAISSALAAQPQWETLDDLQKRKFLIDVIEQLRKNKEEFVTELQKTSGSPLDACQKEVDEALATLYYWMTQNDKYNGPVQEIKNNLMALQNRNPLGVISIQCPDEKPLLSFVSLIIPAIMYGNAVVAIASISYPTLALKLCEIFTSANVPGGVINVIWGDTCSLVPVLRKHSDVNAVWYTDVPNEVIFSQYNATQRLFHCIGIWNDINEANSLKLTMESTYTKSIFLPAGEIFAN